MRLYAHTTRRMKNSHKFCCSILVRRFFFSLFLLCSVSHIFNFITVSTKSVCCQLKCMGGPFLIACAATNEQNINWNITIFVCLFNIFRFLFYSVLPSNGIPWFHVRECTAQMSSFVFILFIQAA